MREKHIQRREALKILGSLGAALLAPRLIRSSQAFQQSESSTSSPNVILIVFDSLSARHMHLYGYGRNTTPHIERFAESATVYHRNYSASNFTQSSTASMLTGVYPWSHRSLDFFETLLKPYEHNNIFSEVAPHYQTIAYTHNIHVMDILDQFRSNIHLLKAIDDLVVYKANKLEFAFKNDPLIGEFAAKRWLEQFLSPSYSFFLNPLFKTGTDLAITEINAEFKKQYPLGLSENDGYLFKLEDAIDWIIRATGIARSPFLGYFHMLPPHEIYRPRAGFYGMFANDGFHLPAKPPHFFSEGVSEEEQRSNCELYDEYVADVDAEFGRLIEGLQEQGLLENSYLILTSDHGQLFERGIHGHVQPTLYDSVIHTPLLIHAPGQRERADVFSPTSSLDLLPTIRKITGMTGSVESDGQVLPGMGGSEDAHTIFSMYARENAKQSPFTTVTYAAIQWPFKLIEYRGYRGLNDLTELYNLDKDPEELTNIAEQHPEIVSTLREALHLSEAYAEAASLRSNHVLVSKAASSTKQ